MNKNVYEYFMDLHSKDLPKNEHSFVMDRERIVEQGKLMSAYGSPNLTIDGTSFHAKKMHKKHPMMEFATDAMYKEIGIPVLPIYPLETDGKGDKKFKTISQHVYDIDGLIFAISGEIQKDRDFSYFRVFNDYKWAMFYDKKLQEVFLKYMTPECFEMLGALYLIDELRTEVDRHEDNLFYAKDYEDRKLSTILAFDNELAEILLVDTPPTSKEEFERFIKHPYFSYTPQNGSSPQLSYQTRIDNFKKLIQDNVLTPRQIKMVEAALKFDFPTEIKKAGTHPYLQDEATTAYDAVSRLWEYNNTELGKELGM